MRILLILSPFFLAISGLVYLQTVWFAPDGDGGQGMQVAAVQVPAVQVPAVQVPALQVPAVQVPAVEVPAMQVPTAQIEFSGVTDVIARLPVPVIPVIPAASTGGNTGSTELQSLASTVLGNLGVQTVITPTDAAIRSTLASLTSAQIPAQLTAQALSETTVDSNGKRFYTIAQGDSLTSLAHRFYGDAAQAGRIFEANTDRLSSPNLIRLGQRLYIPG